ncbi:hypothetical protein AXG93_4542s1260 [Marchantia polymorpha subsp. ruderalis]|uniref:Uncharacterized protein n=1 Tax=Marchantia polymorpha subsp. ruderalis TaxID=1480154 RepID=A0A176W2A2_MARPO|nr:hypothetical protein AXG93_4542s1260 [Marchantia polymorpha subsp. ruderalis]
MFPIRHQERRQESTHQTDKQFLPPYRKENFEKHLTSEHPEKWATYQSLAEDEKAAFFISGVPFVNTLHAYSGRNVKSFEVVFEAKIIDKLVAEYRWKKCIEGAGGSDATAVGVFDWCRRVDLPQYQLSRLARPFRVVGPPVQLARDRATDVWQPHRALLVQLPRQCVGCALSTLEYVLDLRHYKRRSRHDGGNPKACDYDRAGRVA